MDVQIRAKYMASKGLRGPEFTVWFKAVCFITLLLSFLKYKMAHWRSTKTMYVKKLRKLAIALGQSIDVLCNILNHSCIKKNEYHSQVTSAPSQISLTSWVSHSFPQLFWMHTIHHLIKFWISFLPRHISCFSLWSLSLWEKKPLLPFFSEKV